MERTKGRRCLEILDELLLGESLALCDGENSINDLLRGESVKLKDFLAV